MTDRLGFPQSSYGRRYQSQVGYEGLGRVSSLRSGSYSGGVPRQTTYRGHESSRANKGGYGRGIVAVTMRDQLRVDGRYTGVSGTGTAGLGSTCSAARDALMMATQALEIARSFGADATTIAQLTASKGAAEALITRLCTSSSSATTASSAELEALRQQAEMLRQQMQMQQQMMMQLAAERQGGSSGTPTWLWPVVAVGGLGVAAIVAIVLLRRRKG